MTFSKRASFKTQIAKASLLAFAALGIVFPSVNSAQASTTSAAERTVLADGVYLFGQSPNPNEMGSTYTVFSVENNQATGAFYQPNSSFDCFSGEALPNQLAVNVVDSYTQTTHPYAVALTLEDSFVAGTGAGAYTLEGFHRIEDLSSQDHKILATCQADLAL